MLGFTRIAPQLTSFNPRHTRSLLGHAQPRTLRPRKSEKTKLSAEEMSRMNGYYVVKRTRGVIGLPESYAKNFANLGLKRTHHQIRIKHSAQTAGILLSLKELISVKNEYHSEPVFEGRLKDLKPKSGFAVIGSAEGVGKVPLDEVMSKMRRSPEQIENIRRNDITLSKMRKAEVWNSVKQKSKDRIKHLGR